MKKFFAFLLCILALSSLFFSCYRKDTDLKKELERICFAEKLPAGMILTGFAKFGEPDFFPDSLLKSTYGDEILSLKSEILEEYCGYFSSTLPFEIVIFRCKAKSDTEKIAKICFKRSDFLKVGTKNTGIYESAKNIRVGIKGRFVYLIFTPDSLHTEEILRKAL